MLDAETFSSIDGYRFEGYFGLLESWQFSAACFWPGPAVSLSGRHPSAAKPNSLQSIYARAEEAAEKLCIRQESNTSGAKEAAEKLMFCCQGTTLVGP
jgi:hypothetical protein